MNGIELCRHIRESETACDMPIVMLIAGGDEFDQVLGLKIGVDDYITKPFSMSEVIARIKALLHRSRHVKLEAAETVFVVGNLSINLDQHMVTKNGNELIMPLKEFNLLLHMIENKGRVLTREQLLDHVWGYDYVRENGTVDVHVWNLRKKVDNDPNHPALIETVRGMGYRFSAK